MNQLYKIVGISKQAVHQYEQREQLFNNRVSNLVKEADELRYEHPGCGVEKMYYTLKPDFIGRDRFIELFMGLGFKIKKKRNYKRTTYSTTMYYPNLIKGLRVEGPSTVWQSDITYIEVGDRFYYAVFITDVYTKKIVGYNVSDNMRATANIKALQLALKHNKAPIVHHSDRGSQYIYEPYIEMLKANNCKISMALKAQDNAYAERINRTIKEEYLSYWHPKSLEQLKKCVREAVSHYNNKRKHNHLNRNTPLEFEKKWLRNKFNPIPSFTIFDEQTLN
jgi:predicted house-cleaning noncanonical NTP pyrophosphatase (MazG superfamily)